MLKRDRLKCNSTASSASLPNGRAFSKRTKCARRICARCSANRIALLGRSARPIDDAADGATHAGLRPFHRRHVGGVRSRQRLGTPSGSQVIPYRCKMFRRSEWQLRSRMAPRGRDRKVERDRCAERLRRRHGSIKSSSFSIAMSQCSHHAQLLSRNILAGMIESCSAGRLIDR